MGEAMDRDGDASDSGVSVPPIVNETKLHIMSVMGELGRPVVAAELFALWSGTKTLSVFDYHLCTLVKAGVVEVVSGPELHFHLTDPRSKSRVLEGLSGSGAV
jgi:hypothetical protein